MTKEINSQHSEGFNQSASYRLAGFWIRFWAFLIDLAVIAMSGKILLIVIWPAGLENNIGSPLLPSMLFLWVPGSSLPDYHDCGMGQTVGKMLGHPGNANGWK